jgi:hypothetical protein
MKIAIQPSAIGITNKIISYCSENNINYKIVDCFDDSIIDNLSDCNILVWDHDLLLQKDYLLGKRMMFALSLNKQIITYPSIEEGWHYDDKIGQKYLLESINAPFVPTNIYYDKQKALSWFNKQELPLVFKLKGGAGSSNVKLIKTKKQGLKLINKMFSRGIKPVRKEYFLKESFRKYKEEKKSKIDLIKSSIKYLLPLNKNFISEREKGYVYFQKFIKNNEFDVRIVVINQEKAFGIKRYNRKNDFRASGSGKIEYLNPDNINLTCLEIAFQTAKKLKMDSIAYDFVFENGNPKIVEITYSYGLKATSANGYWNNQFQWFPKKIELEKWIIENLILNIKANEN